MFQEIISRSEAKERSLTRYFTGKPCKHWHVAERIVSNGTCIECSRSKDAEYRKKNADKLSSKKANYYQKNSEKIRAKFAKYRNENNDNVRANDRKSYKLRVDKMRENNAELYKEKAEKKRAYRAIFRKKNPGYDAWYRNENRDKISARLAKRRAIKRERLPSWYGEFDQLVMTEAADLAKQREVLTGFVWHVDHMIPLRATEASGLHCANNLQVIPGVMNMKKLNRLELTQRGEWIRAL